MLEERFDAHEQLVSESETVEYRPGYSILMLHDITAVNWQIEESILMLYSALIRLTYFVLLFEPWQCIWYDLLHGMYL